MSNKPQPLAGGLYVFLTMRANPGDCHWGLYHHYSTTLPPTTSPTTVPNSKKPRIILRGKKYHVRNISDGYFAEHAVIGDMVDTLFLVGLLQVGTVPPERWALVDATICALDAQVPLLSAGNSIFCRTWVTGRLRALVSEGFIQTSASDDEIWADIQSFGEKEWLNAEQAVQPRPIASSLLFD